MRWISPLVFLMLLFPTTLFAQGAPLVNPSSIIVAFAEGYNDILETNDQFYLIVFDIFYADATDRPDENASQTIIVRLSSSTGLHAVAVPVSFVHRGYVRGITGMYFPASDSDLPTWTDATLVAQVVGNPALTWESGQPLSNEVNPADNTAADSDAQMAAIVTFLRGQVPLMENNWFEATGEPIDLIGGQPSVLTALGEEYFQLASPDQRNVTPGIYSFVVANPDIVSYGRTRLTLDVLAAANNITVDDASTTGIAVDQEITIIGAAVFETVTVTIVAGNVVTFTPVLANGYSVGDEVWITAPVLQSDIDALVAGTFLATILNGGAGAFDISTTMFGTLLGIFFALVGGGVVWFTVRAIGPAAFLIGSVAAFVFLMLFAFMGIVPIVVLGLVGTLLVVAAIFQLMWKF